VGLSVYLTAFLASMANVFLRAFQQLNVVHGRRALVIPTSVAMSACEVLVFVQIARSQSWTLVAPIGLGAGIGCLAAMALHKKVRKER